MNAKMKHRLATKATIKDVRFRMSEVKREMQQLQFRINAMQRMMEDVKNG